MARLFARAGLVLFALLVLAVLWSWRRTLWPGFWPLPAAVSSAADAAAAVAGRTLPVLAGSAPALAAASAAAQASGPGRAVAAAAPAPAGPPGVLKCRRGHQVVYTADACPPGYTAQSLGGGTVTVVDSAAVLGRAAPARAPGAAPAPRAGEGAGEGPGEAGLLHRDDAMQRARLERAAGL